MTSQRGDFADQIADRIVQEAIDNPLTWWWLSFADPDRPEGDKFLGACIVRAHGFVHAVMEAHGMKCNPGGQIKGVPFPPHLGDVDLSPWSNRVLDREECAQYDRWMEDTYL